MKTIKFNAILLFMLLLLTGCSSDDNVLQIQEEFLSARVNSENFDVETQNGLFFAQKQIASNGAITLLAKIKTDEGKTIEFRILNYFGERSYPLGNRQFLEQGSFVNGNWSKYIEDEPSSIWSTENDSFYTGVLPNTIEITLDDGSYIAGNFSFEGYDRTGASSKMISEGKFNLRVRP